MAQSSSEPQKAGRTTPGKVSREIMLKMYRNIYATRQFELKSTELYRRGMVYGYLHPYLGEEAVAAGACAALRQDDYIVSTHRGHGHCISKGADLKLMIAELMGRETGYCKGRGGSMHISSKTDSNLGANGIVGAGIPIACGAGMSIKIKGGDQVAVVFFGDGGSNQGVFGESLNFASVFNLPVIFMLENNHFAVSTPVELAAASCELSKIGSVYGVPGFCVDGNDAEAVYTETNRAVARARSGEGPSLIEASTYRHGGHHVNDPGTYMDPEVLAEWKKRDPLHMLRQKLDESAAQKIEKAVDEEIEAAIEFAANSPEPSVAEYLQSLPE